MSSRRSSLYQHSIKAKRSQSVITVIFLITVSSVKALVVAAMVMVMVVVVVVVCVFACLGVGWLEGEILVSYLIRPRYKTFRGSHLLWYKV